MSCIQVIYLNGPSSSGKTTLARAVQEASETAWLRLGIDTMISMMPKKANDWRPGISRAGRVDNPTGFSWDTAVDAEGYPVYTPVVGTLGKQIEGAFRAVACTLLEQGCYLIIDDVARPDEVEAWRQALAAYRVLWVGLTAPLAVLEERERARGDRVLGLARSQAAVVHKSVQYDLFLNSGELSVEEIVQQVLSRI